MAGPTIHQRLYGWLWHWRTGPGWCTDGAEINKLNSDGMEVLRVQLQDDGPIPEDQVVEWQAAGMRVWGAIGHVSGQDPRGLAQWVRDERVRLNLQGMDMNFEEDVRQMDADSGGQWSVEFTKRYRELCPTLPAHINTYYGSAAASPGINLGAYRVRGFRLTLQSYWGEGIWDDPPTRMVQWTKGASPSWPKSVIKPLHRVVAPGSGQYAGQLPDWDVVWSDTGQAGTKGCGFYYIDGCDFGRLRELTREAIRRGAAY